jgi:hypothetical protein
VNCGSYSTLSAKNRSNKGAKKIMTAKSSKLEVKKTTAKAATARLFFLSASNGEVFSANPDGSDLKIIVSEGRRIPDGIIVDVEAGHLYWTNMGNRRLSIGSTFTASQSFHKKSAACQANPGRNITGRTSLKST